jgi:hypothetical protein
MALRKFKLKPSGHVESTIIAIPRENGPLLACAKIIL